MQSVQRLDPVLSRVRAEFREMPCLRISPGQAQRLFGLPPDVCAEVLRRLTEEGTVHCDARQRYGRAA